MSLIIGLTGSIASGKSTVTGMFKSLDIPVIDADQIAREIVEPGKQTYHNIVRTFGEGILYADKVINRKKLGSIVFANEEKLMQLNEIVHPAIKAEIEKQKMEYVQAKARCVVLDIPLLYENQLVDLVDQVIVVYVDEKTQLDRLMARDHFTETEARQRISSQLSLQEKVKLANVTIDNNGDKLKTKKQLINILKKWQVI